MASADAEPTCAGRTGNFSVRQVRAFIAAATSQNFTRAARQVHQTQSAFSRSIQDLESELGEALFARTSHGVVLSAAGEAFLPFARRILACHAETLSFMARHREASRCRVVLAGIPDVTNLVLPSLMRRVRGSLEHAALQYEDGSSPDVLEAVASGRADFGLCLLMQPRLDLECVPLLSAPFGLLAHPTMPLPSEIRTMADLDGVPMVRVLGHQVLAQVLRHQNQPCEAHDRAAVTCSTMPTALPLIQEGLVATLATAVAASHALAQGLRFVPLPQLLPAVQLCLVSRVHVAFEPHLALAASAIVASVANAAWHACATLLDAPRAQARLTSQVPAPVGPRRDRSRLPV